MDLGFGIWLLGGLGYQITGIWVKDECFAFGRFRLPFDVDFERWDNRVLFRPGLWLPKPSCIWDLGLSSLEFAYILVL